MFKPSKLNGLRKKYNNYKTKARKKVPYGNRLSASLNTLRKIPVSEGGLPSKDFGKMDNRYKYSNTPQNKLEFTKSLSYKPNLNYYTRLVETGEKIKKKHKHLPPGKPRSAGKMPRKYRGGSNSFKRKVNNTIKSRKLASQTRFSNVNVLKSAVDQLKKKLEACEKKNKKLKESNIVLSAWKHSMEKLTKKINRGNI